MREKKSYKNFEWKPEEVKKLISNCDYVIGIDEVGRGAIAGPLIVCSLLQETTTFIDGVKDSKELSEKNRETIFQTIVKNSIRIGIGTVSNEFIDHYGMSISLRLAILKSLSNIFSSAPLRLKLIITDYVKIKNTEFELFLKNTFKDPKLIEVYERLVQLNDPNQLNLLNDFIYYIPLKKADRDIHVVSSSSIVAKVIRDRYMKHISLKYPQYHFSKNKGYCSKEHIDAIKRFGLCKIHRVSFNLYRYLDKQLQI